MAPSCERQVVRCNQRRQLVLAMQSREQLENYFGGSPIEIASGFVRKQKLRLADQSPGQGQPLLLTAGQFARAVMTSILKANFAKPTRGVSFGLCAGNAAGQQRHSNILQGGKFRQQIVKLPDKADLAIAKFGGSIIGERIHQGVGAVYGTGRRTIKSAENMQ